MTFARAAQSSMMLASLIATMSLTVRAAEPVSPWPGFDRLDVHLEEVAIDPFLEFRLPKTSPAANSARAAVSSPTEPDSVSEAALPPDRNKNLQSQRTKLRESLAQQGLAAVHGRDELTSEVFSVTKWTIVTLVVGTVVVIGIKQFNLRTLPVSKSPGIRLVETFSLGRHQGLNLVEVGGERFLVATDQGGIKSVTLLPNWPRMDEPNEETSEPRIFHVGPRESAASDDELAA
jgi:hypothetical protein